jgi:hypothetical protein
MRRTQASAGLAVTALVLALGVSKGTAAVAIRPAAGVPDPRLMVLTARDLSGAKVSSQGYYKDKDFPSVISYSRELEGGGLGGVGLPYVDSEAEIGVSTGTTARYLGTLKAALGTKQGRALVAKSFESKVQGGGAISKVQVGRPRSFGLGPGSFDLRMSVRLLGLRTELHVAAFRVQQVLDAVVVVGTPGKRVPLATMAKLAKIMAARTTAELVPRNTIPPAISGVPAVGQTLTASTGAWKGSPTGFSYQWQRCDASGNACASISGATAQTYVVVPDDVGATVRVVVTARSAVGPATASSAATAVVQASGAPANTAPPTIVGTPQVGQTLTAGTGTWSASPTSFGFQWQRCNASGAACVDIAAATAGTYLVSSSDVGSTLRVVVTATNVSGSASAPSAATAVVT